MSRSFDSAGRLATQSGLGFSATATYSYDANTGRKSSESLPLVLGGAIAASYSYYPGGALAAASDAGGAASYAYDEAGSLVLETQTPAGEAETQTTTYSYDAAGRLASTTRDPGDGSTPQTTYYGFDTANAWRTSQGPQSEPALRPVQMSYTAQGRLATYANAEAQTTATYSYDAAGQRTRSVVTVAGVTTTTSWAYDEGLALMYLAATQGSASWRIDYLYDEEGAVWGGVYRSPASSTSPIYFTLVTTDRGDVVELLDAKGSAFCAYRYDPWGLPTATLSQGTTLVSSTLAGEIAARQVLRYAAYVWDAESSLYYCSARSYDPATRQWTTGDPAKADGEASAYQYCSGNPVRAVDPGGEHEKWLPITNPRHPYYHKTPRQRIYYAAMRKKGTSRDKVLEWCERMGEAEEAVWCADAVSYICASARSEPFMGYRATNADYCWRGKGFAWVDQLMWAAKAGWRGLKWWGPGGAARSKARRGDIVLYDWSHEWSDSSDFDPDHVGIVISMKDRKTIEGNRGSFGALEKIRIGQNKVDTWKNHTGFVHPSH